MTEKRLVRYKVLCDEDDEIARILFEIVETGEEIEGYHQIQEWVNNLYKEKEQLKKENEKLESLWEDKCIRDYMKFVGENALQEMHNEKYGDK